MASCLLVTGLVALISCAVAVEPPGWPDLATVPPDLEIPPLTDNAPAPGLRVKQTLPAWRETTVYHVVYLPPDWQPSRRFPVIVEYAGNGGYQNKYGDVSTGRPEGSKLGFGMSAGRSLGIPFKNPIGAVSLKGVAGGGRSPNRPPRISGENP